MVAERGYRLLQLPCGTGQLPGVGPFQEADIAGMAGGASQKKPEGEEPNMGANDEDTGRVATSAANTPSISGSTPLRQQPKVGAG